MQYLYLELPLYDDYRKPLDKSEDEDLSTVETIQIFGPDEQEEKE